MFPSAWSISLWLVPSFAMLAHCSVEFFIDQVLDQCSRDNTDIACLNNTDRGGLCAYAPDANMLWCCPAPDPSCWGFGSSCTGGSSGAPGPGQISCSNEGAQWCCNQEYERCTQTKNQINVCETNFASANANVTIAEANAVESSSTSSSSLSTTSLSRISSTPSTASSQATTSSSSPASSQSNSPDASRSSSHLASGAIAGIVVGVVVAVACLLGFLWIGIRRARRRDSNQAQAMPPMEGNGIPTFRKGFMKAELDGKRSITELPSQELSLIHI